MNDGSQDGEATEEEEGQRGIEETAADDTANGEEDAEGDEEPALPDSEEPDLNLDQGPGNTPLEPGSQLLTMPREILAQVCRHSACTQILANHFLNMLCPDSRVRTKG